jgi:hypothetical protein
LIKYCLVSPFTLYSLNLIPYELDSRPRFYYYIKPFA